MSTSITNISDFVEIKDEEVYTTSRIVAEKFGKRHTHIIRDIEATISTINDAQVIENKVQPNFGLNENINQPKFGLVKNDYFIADINVAQVIENTTQRNFPFSDFFIEATY